MKPQINLLIAWLLILLGIASGLYLGLNFHRENWLGGYASFKRRLYRLGHISFFGLGAVNLFFRLTEKNLPVEDSALGLMRDSGCQQVLIGFESPGKSSLEGLELNNNWKVHQQDRYKAAIARIQSYGITVNGCFILGLDGDTPEVFADVLHFVRDPGLYEVQVTFLTAFPGTPLYARLKTEGRIICDKAWELCTLFDINITPKNLGVDELQKGFLQLAKQLYSAEETSERRRKFRTRLKTSPNFGQRPQSRKELLAA